MGTFRRNSKWRGNTRTSCPGKFLPNFPLCFLTISRRRQSDYKYIRWSPKRRSEYTSLITEPEAANCFCKKNCVLIYLLKIIYFIIHPKSAYLAMRKLPDVFAGFKTQNLEHINFCNGDLVLTQKKWIFSYELLVHGHITTGIRCWHESKVNCNG